MRILSGSLVIAFVFDYNVIFCRLFLLFAIETLSLFAVKQKALPAFRFDKYLYNFSFVPFAAHNEYTISNFKRI